MIHYFQTILQGAFACLLSASALAVNGPGWVRVQANSSAPQGSAFDGGTLASQKTTAASLSASAPAAGASAQGVVAAALSSTGNEADAITPEIQGLADSLKHDADAIFLWVRGNIEYEHYYGARKGAHLAMLERSGNDADQCALLASLFRASGIQAGYISRLHLMPYSSPDNLDIAHWLNVTEAQTGALFVERGIPSSEYFLSVTNYPGYAALRRIVVECSVNGQTVVCDPSYKMYDAVAGLNAAISSGFSTTSALLQAGGTESGNGYSGLSNTNVSTYLAGRSGQLATSINTAFPNDDAISASGGYRLSESQTLYYSPFQIFEGNDQSWNVIPTTMFSTIQVQMTGLTQTEYFLSLAGKRLSLEFSATNYPQLWVDDTMLVQGTSASVAAPNVTLTIDHPGTDLDQVETKPYVRGQKYVITYGFTAGTELINQRQKQLDLYREQGNAEGSRKIVLESLNLIGLNWLRESQLSRNLLSGQEKISSIYHHRVGRVAQETVNTKTGFYIDVGAQVYSATKRGATGDVEAFTFADQLIASAMEHAVISQLQGATMIGASTVRLVTNHAATSTVFRATPANWAAVKLLLTGYSPAEITRFDAMFALGADATNFAMIPSNGQIIINSWTGSGFATRETTSAGVSTGMWIGGSLMGGYGTVAVSILGVPVTYYANTQQNAVSVGHSAPSYTPPAVIDPVDAASGQFMFNTEQLSIGGASPRGLSFGLRYHGGKRNQNTSNVGYGWSHSMDVRIKERSEFENTLGSASAREVAVGLMGTRAVLELCRDLTSAKKSVVATSAAMWLSERLVSNAVSMTLNERSYEFLKNADGTYQSPRGLTIALSLNTTLTPNVLEAKERNGSTYRFDVSNRLSKIIDLWNRTATLNYDTNGRISTVVDAYGRTFTFTYNTGGELTNVADVANSRSVLLEYTGGNLTKFTDPEGAFDSFEYDAQRRFSKHINGAGETTVWNTVFDSSNRVVEQQSYGLAARTYKMIYGINRTIEEDPAGGQIVHQFDNRGREVARTDALGRVFRMVFDGQDHQIKTISPLGNTEEVAYDGNHNVTSRKDANGNIESFTYDPLLRLQRHTDKKGAFTDFTYNAQHLPRTVTKKATNQSGALITLVTDITYDAFGNVQTTTPPNSPATTNTYTTKDELWTSTAPGSAVTTIIYDGMGNPATTTDARGKTTTIVFNKRRQPTSLDAPLIPAATTHYDTRRNVDYTINPRGVHTTMTYSPTQKLLTSTFFEATTTLRYDVRDWLDEITDPLGNKSKTTYQGDGRPLFHDDPLLHRTSSTFDADGRPQVSLNPLNEGTFFSSYSARGELQQTYDVVGSIDANGVASVTLDTQSFPTGSYYDLNGNLTDRMNRKSLWWAHTYDELNRPMNSTSPAGRVVKNDYNNRGLLFSVKEPSNQSTELAYDSRGRAQTRTGKLANGTVDHTQTFTYDNNSNPLTVTEGAAVLTRTFDDLNRISTYTNGSAEQIGYQYDDNSNLKILTYPDGKTVQYTYDYRDRLATVTDWGSRVTTYSWDDNNRLTLLVRPNGTKRSITYDAAGQVKQIDEFQADGRLINRQSMGYDAAGRVTSTFTAPLPTPYSEAAMTATFDDDDRMTTLNGAALSYDLDGNLLGGPLPNGPWGVLPVSEPSGTFTWDMRNRLTAVTRSLTEQLISYSYDPEGFLETISTPVLGGQTERLTVDPHGGKRSQVLVRNHGDGTKTRQVYGLGLLYEVRADGAVRYFHYDSLGSTVALTDAAGAITGRVQYGTFGAAATSSGDGLSTPWLWHGRHGVWTDKHTGMHQMRARWYSSALRRFLNPDPAGFAGGSNFYLYANGDPVSMIDPFGLGAEYRSEGYSMINLRQSTCMDCHGLPWRERAQMGLAAQQPYTTQTYKNISQAVGMTGIALAAAPVAAEGYAAAYTWAAVNSSAINTTAVIVGAAYGVNSGPRLTQPGGRLGNPMTVAKGTNTPATVNGVNYSAHALDQMQGRGIVPSVVENTIAVGTPSPGNLSNTTVYYDAVNQLRVVVNSVTGKVITVITGK